MKPTVTKLALDDIDRQHAVVDVPIELPTDLPYSSLVHNKVETSFDKSKPTIFLLDQVVSFMGS